MSKKITIFGGGTGSFVILSGLKEYHLDLAAIVTMMDSGGSTGRLRDQLEVLPPGDLRQCLVALSDAPLLWRKLFSYRFTGGDLIGHNFGNIFLSVLEKITGNYHEVVKTVSHVLKTKGQVIPVTLAKTHLCAQYTSGRLIKQESRIEENKEAKGRISRVYLDPKVKANPEAIVRILHSDFLVFGPGDLYTSIIPTLLAEGIQRAVFKTNANIIFNMNLMTKLGQTSDYKASDHIEGLERYLGRPVDTVILNHGKIDKDILKYYLSCREIPVSNDLKQKGTRAKIISADLIDRKPYRSEKGDRLIRSIVRHDQKKLARLLYSLFI